MKDGPNIAFIAALIGDPARANILTNLMDGRALTASELALESGVTRQTASSHLAKLLDGKLLVRHKQGRHSYFALADDHVADVLEALFGLAAQRGHYRIRTGPKEPALRAARVCYDHLAGAMGVRLTEMMMCRGFVVEGAEGLAITAKGERFFTSLGLHETVFSKGRRPVCRACLDWSERRYHIGGRLGAALLDFMVQEGWVVRARSGRALTFTSRGREAFETVFARPNTAANRLFAGSSPPARRRPGSSRPPARRKSV